MGWAFAVLKPKMTNERRSRIVIVVAAAWNTPVKRRLRRCAAVTPATSRKVITCSPLLGIARERAGKAWQTYWPKAWALMAMGAAKPMVTDVSPVQNPTAGW